MKNSRESNNNNKPRKEIIMNIPNTNKPHRNQAAALLGAAFLCILLLALSIGTASAAPTSPPAPTATLLTTFNAIGFGSTVGPDGMLYVTDPTHGQILRVDPSTGSYTVFASGLPKTPPGFGDGGTFDVTFIGNTAYALVSEVSSDLNYLDPSLDLHDIDGIYRIDGPDRFTIVADIGAWSIAHPPPPGFDVVVFSGVQFSFLPYGDGFVVNDGHHNRVLHVTLDGQITQLLQFGDVVPTGMARWGTRFYMSQAGPLVQGPPRVEIGQIVVRYEDAESGRGGGGHPPAYRRGVRPGPHAICPVAGHPPYSRLRWRPGRSEHRRAFAGQPRRYDDHRGWPPESADVAQIHRQHGIRRLLHRGDLEDREPPSGARDRCFVKLL